MGSDEPGFFGLTRAELVARYAGQFAVVCGRKLMGVHSSLEQALEAAAELFGGGGFEEGAPILISEIAAETKLRLVAEPRSPAIP
jgi:hypothetical protein